MLAILGEDRSDVDTLKILAKRIASNSSLQVKTKGFGSGSELFKKGLNQIKLMQDLGCTLFIIAHDADSPDPAHYIKRIRTELIDPITLKHCCALVPVQEIESWILADVESVTKLFSSWKPKPIKNVENISSPKEYLEKLSRAKNTKPRYSHATHNEKLANLLDLDVVHSKCKSFRPLYSFIYKHYQ